MDEEELLVFGSVITSKDEDGPENLYFGVNSWFLGLNPFKNVSADRDSIITGAIIILYNIFHFLQ